MNLDQFGQTLKDKAGGAYQNVDNTALSLRFLAKYPQYGSQIDDYSPSPSQVGQNIGVAQQGLNLQTSQATQPYDIAKSLAESGTAQLNFKQKQNSMQPIVYPEQVFSSGQGGSSNPSNPLSMFLMPTPPKNEKEYRDTWTQINQLRDYALSQDAQSTGGALKEVINKHYDDMVKGLDPTGSFVATSKEVASRKAEDDYNYKIAKGSLEPMLKTFSTFKLTGPVGSKIAFAPGAGQYYLKGTAGPEQEYEAQRKAMALGLKNIQGGNGVRVNLPEISQWATLLPATDKTPEKNQYDVQTLNGLVKGRFGQGLSPEILSKYKLDANGIPIKSQSTKPLPPRRQYGNDDCTRW